MTFVEVPDRTGATLMHERRRFMQPGSVVVADEWSGYNQLKRNGLVHEKVNHSNNYINPYTGFDTQSIERTWVSGNAKINSACRPHD